MIRVCDAIMGTGKSSATITYINEHPDGKYIYITPYLDEAARIKNGCRDAHFVEPQHLREYGNRKLNHTARLIKEGKNIATTHQSFKNYTQETLDDIRAQGYTLIIDESVEVLATADTHPDDFQILADAGWISEKNGVYSMARDNYSGKAFGEAFSLLQSRELIKMTEQGEKDLYYWALPPDLFTSFKDIYILTYLFEAQSLCHFLKIFNLPYTKIGIERTADGAYRFCDAPGYVPDYASRLRDMVHIIEDDKLNEIGDSRYALSISWYRRDADLVDQLRKNIVNCYNNRWRGVKASRKMWGAYKSVYNSLKGKGYASGFVVFNMKATNQFRGRDHLAYPTNIFMNVNEKKFYQMHGIEVDEDKYALSIMVQWLWRSAIRDGHEIELYIPSRRMRELLKNWIHSFENGGAAA